MRIAHEKVVATRSWGASTRYREGDGQSEHLYVRKTYKKLLSLLFIEPAA